MIAVGELAAASHRDQLRKQRLLATRKQDAQLAQARRQRYQQRKAEADRRALAVARSQWESRRESTLAEASDRLRCQLASVGGAHRAAAQLQARQREDAAEALEQWETVDEAVAVRGANADASQAVARHRLQLPARQQQWRRHAAVAAGVRGRVTAHGYKPPQPEKQPEKEEEEKENYVLQGGDSILHFGRARVQASVRRDQTVRSCQPPARIDPARAEKEAEARRLERGEIARRHLRRRTEFAAISRDLAALQAADRRQRTKELMQTVSAAGRGGRAAGAGREARRKALQATYESVFGADPAPAATATSSTDAAATATDDDPEPDVTLIGQTQRLQPVAEVVDEVGTEIAVGVGDISVRKFADDEFALDLLSDASSLLSASVASSVASSSSAASSAAAPQEPPAEDPFNLAEQQWPQQQPRRQEQVDIDALRLSVESRERIQRLARAQESIFAHRETRLSQLSAQTTPRTSVSSSTGPASPGSQSHWTELQPGTPAAQDPVDISLPLEDSLDPLDDSLSGGDVDDDVPPPPAPSASPAKRSGGGGGTPLRASPPRASFEDAARRSMERERASLESFGSAPPFGLDGGLFDVDGSAPPEAAGPTAQRDSFASAASEAAPAFGAEPTAQRDSFGSETTPAQRDSFASAAPEAAPAANSFASGVGAEPTAQRDSFGSETAPAQRDSFASAAPEAAPAADSFTSGVGAEPTAQRDSFGSETAPAQRDSFASAASEAAPAADSFASGVGAEPTAQRDSFGSETAPAQRDSFASAASEAAPAADSFASGVGAEPTAQRDSFGSETPAPARDSFASEPADELDSEAGGDAGAGAAATAGAGAGAGPDEGALRDMLLAAAAQPVDPVVPATQAVRIPLPAALEYAGATTDFDAFAEAAIEAASPPPAPTPEAGAGAGAAAGAEAGAEPWYSPAGATRMVAAVPTPTVGDDHSWYSAEGAAQLVETKTSPLSVGASDDSLDQESLDDSLEASAAGGAEVLVFPAGAGAGAGAGDLAEAFQRAKGESFAKKSEARVRRAKERRRQKREEAEAAAARSPEPEPAQQVAEPDEAKDEPARPTLSEKPPTRREMLQRTQRNYQRLPEVRKQAEAQAKAEERQKRVRAAKEADRRRRERMRAGRK